MRQYTLTLSSPEATLDMVGGKGASLARMVRAGLPVPGGFHVTTAAYDRFVAANRLGPRIEAALESVDPDRPETLETASQTIWQLFEQAEAPAGIATAIVEAYGTLSGNNPAVAVRSSATAEDLPDASFAGQQETFLNVSGAEAVLQATKRCWASLWTARAIGYRARQRIPTSMLSLAVVVQTLVAAEAAGILFTAHPVSGRRDQTLISAAWGLGEAVVGGQVTPDSLVMDKASGRVLERETADKQVMTVRVDGSTEERPVPANLRRVPVLSDATAAELTALGGQIEALYGMPMDIEWVWADGEFSIVQARPITALPEPEKSLDELWPMPNPKGHYMRASIVDLMPDPLSPLFATLALPAIGRGIGVMTGDLFKFPDIDIFDDLVLTINGYAYEGVSFTARQWWPMITRMAPAAVRMLHDGVDYWQSVARPHYVEVRDRWGARDPAELSPGELLTGVREVLAGFAHQLGALMASTMGPSAGSEVLFTRVYEKLVHRAGDPSAPVFLLGYDSLPIQGEKALFDLALWCRQQESLAPFLAATPAEELAVLVEQSQTPAGVDEQEWQSWSEQFHAYLERHGYSIYDMDFAKPLPMDEPTPILETLRLFVSGEGSNPYERQQDHAERRQQAVERVRGRLKGLRRWAFDKSLKWAQTQAPLREDGIAEIGLGYPVMRRLLGELGRRLAAAGALETEADIYWLEANELESLAAALEQNAPVESIQSRIAQRRDLWQERKTLTPPPQLPPGKKYMGMDMEEVLAGGVGAQEGNVIKGVATSGGRATGTARVLHGPTGFRADAARRRAGGGHHHPRLDAAFRPCLGGGHRHWRAVEPRLYRRPRVRYPGRVGHRSGDSDHSERATGHRGRQRRNRSSAGRGNRGGRVAARGSTRHVRQQP